MTPVTTEQSAAGQSPQRGQQSIRRRAPRLLLLVLLVGAAGAAGSLARWGIGELVPEQGMKFPWVTFSINMAGSGLLGLLVGAVHALPRVPLWVMPTFGTGLLGSFTTFSSVMLAAADSMRLPSMPQIDDAELLMDEIVTDSTQMGIAFAYSPTGEWVAYLVISMLLCSAAAAAGITIGHAIFGHQGDADTLKVGRPR